MKKIIEVIILLGGLMMVSSCSNPGSSSDNSATQNSNNTEVQNGGENGSGTTDPQGENGGGNGSTQSTIELTNITKNLNNVKINGLSSVYISSYIFFRYDNVNYTIYTVKVNNSIVPISYLDFGYSGSYFIEIIGIGDVSHVYIDYTNGVSNATLLIQTN